MSSEVIIYVNCYCSADDAELIVEQIWDAVTQTEYNLLKDCTMKYTVTEIDVTWDGNPWLAVHASFTVSDQTRMLLDLIGTVPYEQMNR